MDGADIHHSLDRSLDPSTVDRLELLKHCQRGLLFRSASFGRGFPPGSGLDEDIANELLAPRLDFEKDTQLADRADSRALPGRTDGLAAVCCLWLCHVTPTRSCNHPMRWIPAELPVQQGELSSPSLGDSRRSLDPRRAATSRYWNITAPCAVALLARSGADRARRPLGSPRAREPRRMSGRRRRHAPTRPPASAPRWRSPPTA